MTRLAIRAATALFAFALLAAPLRAHEGHDHAESELPPAAAANPTLVAEGSEWELVATAKGHTLTLYVDRRETNTPVEGAVIEITREGAASVTAKEIGGGTYEIAGGWLDEPGNKVLTFIVTAGGSVDLLAGTLAIPATEGIDAGTPAGWQALAARPELWLLGLALVLAGFFLSFAFRPLRLPPDAPTKSQDPRNVAQALLVAAVLAAATLSVTDHAAAHEGHDHGAESAPPIAPGSAPARLPTGEVFVPKATQRLLAVRTAPAATSTAQPSSELVGTVIADPAHEGRVQAPMDGQIEIAHGEISFVGKAVAAGEVLAVLAPAMPVYERGSLAQATADVEGKLRIAEQKLARLSRISGDYIPQREIDDTREEIASLREQKRVLEPRNTERLQLTAPVSGIISVATVRAGQVVSARDTLFEIVDPKRLWIEAIGIAGTDDEDDVTAATAVDAEGHRIPLSFVGRAPTLRNQALPLLFRVDEPHASLAIGGTVKVLIRHGARVEGIVVPDAAIVRAPSGLAQVWVKVAPERFAPRLVRTVPLDGERVLVSSGLAAGDRVVVQAAELINQVR